MKVTYSWLKEFVDIRLEPQALSERLSMAGLTVASLQQAGDEWVFDIEVTSNRPDWLSVRGIAREVAAMTGKQFKAAKPENVKLQKKCAVAIKIENRADCSLYFGRSIKGVKPGPSPEWLRKRLETMGTRSVNNIVDITNYCLFELGQPLHAFDLARISGAEINVRRARPGETIVLIDGSQKKLTPNTLVIADHKKPLAAAGIMGGKDSEVTLATKDILLESACFNPVLVRRGTRELGVASDSSYRFERGVDIETVAAGLQAATEMILKYCGGSIEETAMGGSVKREAGKPIAFDISEARDILGLDLTDREAERILKGLGFSVRRAKSRWLVAVPLFRRDIKGKQDITEEIARIYGYEKIPLTQPHIRPCAMKVSPAWQAESKTREFLKCAGLQEVITYSLLSQKDYEQTGLSLPEAALRLKNPLSQDYGVLRTTLVPGLMQSAAYNIKRGNTDFAFFEVAHVYSREKEGLSLCLLLCGERRETWTRQARPYDFFDLKGICAGLFEELGIGGWNIEHAQEAFLRAGSCAGICFYKEKAGVLGQVNEQVKKAWDIKSKKEIFVAELDLDVLAARMHLNKRVHSIAETPSITRDISVLVSPETTFEKIYGLIRQKAGQYLRSIKLVERYEGKGLPEGKSALTINLEYGSGDKTLTDEEIAPVHKAVLDSLVNELSLSLR